MGYLIAAYTVVVGALLAYAVRLHRQRRALARQQATGQSR